MEKRMDMWRESNYYMYMHNGEGLDSTGFFLFWHQGEVMREQGPIRAIETFTLQRNMCASIILSCTEHDVLAICRG